MPEAAKSVLVYQAAKEQKLHGRLTVLFFGGFSPPQFHFLPTAISDVTKTQKRRKRFQKCHKTRSMVLAEEMKQTYPSCFWVNAALRLQLFWGWLAIHYLATFSPRM